MGTLIDFLFDPAAVITAVSGVAAFMALLGILMPYLRPDPMRGRLKATTERRRDLQGAEDGGGPAPLQAAAGASKLGARSGGPDEDPRPARP